MQQQNLLIFDLDVTYILLSETLLYWPAPSSQRCHLQPCFGFPEEHPLSVVLSSDALRQIAGMLTSDFVTRSLTWVALRRERAPREEIWAKVCFCTASSIIAFIAESIFEETRISYSIAETE